MERELERAKRRLLEHLAREISDKRVLSAMARVPREAFIPEASIHLALSQYARGGTEREPVTLNGLC